MFISKHYLVNLQEWQWCFQRDLVLSCLVIERHAGLLQKGTCCWKPLRNGVLGPHCPSSCSVETLGAPVSVHARQISHIHLQRGETAAGSVWGAVPASCPRSCPYQQKQSFSSSVPSVKVNWVCLGRESHEVMMERNDVAQTVPEAADVSEPGQDLVS